MCSDKRIGLWVREIVISILGVLLFFDSLSAKKQDVSIQDTVLNEVLVIANREQVVIPPQKLSGENLRRLNSLSVADAIRYFSGIQIKDYGGIGGLKTVDMRSMGTHHMGVFYDGIQLGNAQNGQIDLGKFSLDNIEEISLYNGQKSEIFQSAKDFGSAGTIYLKTRSPQFTQYKKTNFRAFFRTGSFDLINPSLLWEQKVTKSISASLNAEFIKSSGKYKFRYKKVLPGGGVAWDTTAVRRNGDIQAARIEGGFNGRTEKTSWNAKVYFYDAEKGIPGAIVNNVWKRSQRQWDCNFFTQASLKTEVNHRYSFLVNAKYANDYMRYLNPDTSLMYIDNDFIQQEFYVSMANRYAVFPRWTIALSTDFQWNNLNSNLQNFVHPNRFTALVALASSFDIWKIKAQVSLLGTFVCDKTTRVQGYTSLSEEQTASAPNKKEYTPAVFFSYKPFAKEDFNLRFFYKRIFRMPTFNDLYYTDIGNISLRPEYTTQYNLGFQYTKHFSKILLNTMTLRTDAYYNEVTDKIIAVPKGNGQFRWMMMNLGYVEIRGIDVTAQLGWKLPCHISLQTNINYTYQQARDFSDPTDNDSAAGTWGGQIAYIPWHNGSFTLMASYKNWNLNYSFVYVGERYHNSSNIRENYEQPWYTSDLSFGKNFHIKKLIFSFMAEVNNVLNQHYDVVLNYPMPGRNYKLILKFDI